MKYLVIGSILTITYSIFYPVLALAGSDSQAQVQEQTQNNNQSVNVSNTLTSGSNRIEPKTVNAATPSPTPTPIQSGPTPTPQVIAQVPVQAKELPRTGPAEAALALASLLPIGYKLRGIKRNKTDITTANSIWTEREWKK